MLIVSADRLASGEGTGSTCAHAHPTLGFSEHRADALRGARCKHVGFFVSLGIHVSTALCLRVCSREARDCSQQVVLNVNTHGHGIALAVPASDRRQVVQRLCLEKCERAVQYHVG